MSHLRAGVIVGALLGGAALAAPPGALAGTARGDIQRVEACDGKPCDYYFDPFMQLRVVFSAFPGERNVVSTRESVDQGTRAAITVTDSGPELLASGRCRRVTTRQAQCSSEFSLDVSVQAGDWDDIVEGVRRASLGPGDDTGRAFSDDDASDLDGNAGADLLVGGTSTDDLDGGTGNDRLVGGTGSDLLFGGPGRDRLSGGPGTNTLDGEQGPDRIAGGVGDDESFGGAGGDRIFGGRGRDHLRGESGDDLLRGGPGVDDISGGTGRDRIDAGTGNDRLETRDRQRDRVRCGRGRDRVRGDRFDVLVGCEVVSRR